MSMASGQWSRTRAAIAARELILRGVFGSIMASYSYRRVRGHEHLDGLAGPVILVANHCSHVDTPVLLLSLPGPWRRRTAVAAATDFFYAGRPLRARAVSLAFGTVPVDRHGRGACAPEVPIRRVLREGWSLVLFAEGTRSRDGRVGPMRSGAAVLAAEHRVPIVPVFISGTGVAMPIGRQWMVRPEGGGRHHISVTFGAPIEVRSGDHAGSMERVREFMRACGAELASGGEPAARAARVAALT